MTLELVVAPEAEADLRSIWRYVALKNESAAGELIRQITDKFSFLMGAPEAGRVRLDIAPGLRSFPTGRYVIFYRVTVDSVTVVRVLHSARDISAIFQ